MLEKLAIELMRHENIKNEIFNDAEHFYYHEINEKAVDENNIPCSTISIHGTEGTIKIFTYYL